MSGLISKTARQIFLRFALSDRTNSRGHYDFIIYRYNPDQYPELINMYISLHLNPVPLTQSRNMHFEYSW